jgi:hypothetical protein
MLARHFLTLALIANPPLVGIVAAQSSTAPKPQPRNTVQHAKWSSELETTWGITPELFRDMGLSALTTGEEVQLLTWEAEQVQKAKDSDPRPSFVCGRPGVTSTIKPEDYDKVRIYVEATGNASEIISGVRQRFRGMNGTEVVYTADEADVTVSLVAMNSENMAGQRTGVAISYVVQQPCIWAFGKQSVHYDSVENQGLQMGSNVPDVVDSIVSSIDTSNLESHRQSNAFTKKMIQELKK